MKFNLSGTPKDSYRNRESSSEGPQFEAPGGQCSILIGPGPCPFQFTTLACLHFLFAKSENPSQSSYFLRLFTMSSTFLATADLSSKVYALVRKQHISAVYHRRGVNRLSQSHILGWPQARNWTNHPDQNLSHERDMASHRNMHQQNRECQFLCINGYIHKKQS